jgi:NADH:ubiquinone oxidoreductase subunit 2 (subunit N)
VLAALLAIIMFSLAGLPPLAGFFAKYYVFIAAIKSGLTWLAILGIISSVISVYFYLRIVVLMYFKEAEGEVVPSKSYQRIFWCCSFRYNGDITWYYSWFITGFDYLVSLI